MYELGFLFYSPRVGDMLFEPFGQIYVKSYAEDKGHILLSANFMNEREVDEQVDRLIKQLENIRKKAKKKFRN